VASGVTAAVYFGLLLMVVEDGRPRVREAKEGEVLRRAHVPLSALAAVD
jgi:hypothetical protein